MHILAIEVLYQNPINIFTKMKEIQKAGSYKMLSFKGFYACLNKKRKDVFFNLKKGVRLTITEIIKYKIVLEDRRLKLS